MSFSTKLEGVPITDAFMNLSKGWFIVYNSGELVTENEVDWNSVKRNKIKILGLKWHDKTWILSGRSAYLQFKRGSVSFSQTGLGDSIVCEERCIGYYDEGGSKVVLRVNEYTGKMVLKVQ